ncbi:hypothetical protein MMC06_006115 [Schaereria dolodes]|nr:hypothetical protein [Schaereria dolodes]
MSGWGLYIGEAVKAGEYLGEYVGEIISKEESERRGLIYNKRNLSYLFNLNRDQVLDSTRVGNKFRYINHQTPPYANCRAKILLCNTVQRIGMFAVRNLEIGEELLFDYGDEFTSRFDLIELDENAKPRMERSKGAAGKKSVAAGKAVKVQPATAKKTGARPGRPRKNIQIVKPAEPHIAFLDTDEEVSSEKGGGTAIRKPEDKKGNKRKRATLDRPANKGLDASQDALLSDDNGSLDLMESSAESLYESEDAEEELEVLKSMEARQGEYNNPQKRGWITRKANLVRYETEEELEVVRPRMRLGRGDAQKQGWVTRKANLARSNKPRRR